MTVYCMNPYDFEAMYNHACLELVLCVFLCGFFFFGLGGGDDGGGGGGAGGLLSLVSGALGGGGNRIAASAGQRMTYAIGDPRNCLVGHPKLNILQVSCTS